MIESVKNPEGGGPRRVNLLLLPNFTMLALCSVVDPMRLANQLAGRELYDWSIVTEDGQPVASSGGVKTMADTSIQHAPSCGMLMVVGGWDIAANFTENHLKFLRQLDQQGVRLAGVCTGAYVLAEAGLMDGYKCSTHWENMAVLQERHPLVECNNQLFTITGNRVTSSGGTAALDMMINLVGKDHGMSLANAISQMFILDRIRTESDHQKVPLKLATGMAAPPKLVEATELMEANIEEPISLEELSKMLDISRRQLERLFKNNLNCPPSRYYLRVRLFRARQLLKQTTLPIIDIASLCGFVSTPHFSKCYRTHLGIPPRLERAPRAVHGEIRSGAARTSDGGPRRLIDTTEPSFGSISI